MLGAIAAAPASSLHQALAQARGAAGQAMEREQQQAVAGLPVIDQPTGVAAGAPPPAAPVPAAPVLEPPLPARGGGSGSRGSPPTGAAPAADRPLPAARVDTSAQGQPPPPAAGSGSANGGWWDWLAGRVRRFMSALPTQDAGVSTSAGERPRVELSGEADPNVATAQRQASEAAVAAHRAHADELTHADFGEQNVRPTLVTGTLRPSVRPGPPPAAGGTVLPAPEALPDEYRTEFDRESSPWLHDHVQEQLGSYRREHAIYQQSSRTAHAEGQRQLAEATQATRAQQEQLRGQVRSDVSAERQRWRDEHRQIQENLGQRAADKQQELDRQVTDKVAATQRETESKLSQAEGQAEQERVRAEAEAAAKNKEVADKPKSWWDRVSDAVSSVFDGIKEAVNAVFDRLRQVVKGIIGAAKALVKNLIEAARAAIVGLIQQFGEVLKGLVSMALAAFPELAARARAWIDQRVKAATDAVNRAAEALKQAAMAILDAVGAAIDAALALVQKALIAALDVLEALAKLPFQAIGALTKLVAWLRKNGSFLEGAKKLEAGADEVIEAIRTKLGEMIADVPATAHAKLDEFAQSFGGGEVRVRSAGAAPQPKEPARPVVQRQADVAAPATGKRHVSAGQHVRGIVGALDKGLDHLKAHWWDELKKVGWNLLWPWPAVWGDLKAIWVEIKAGFDDAYHLRVGRVIDHVLSIDQKLNSILGNLYGWFFIGSVLVGTIIGAFFGGAGAIPGALAGAAVAGEVGEALVAALIATETAVVVKGIADLAIGNDTAEQDQQDYSKIGGSVLTIAITVAMMLLGEIAADLAKSIWESASALFKGEKAPEVDVSVETDAGPAADSAPPEADTAPSEAKPEDQLPDTASQKGVAAERATADGHTIKVLEDGRVFICTTCEELNFRYQDELNADTELRQEWDEANAEADPNAKADKVDQLKPKLDEARQRARASETPTAKVNALDTMLQRARTALGELQETLRNKVGRLVKANGPLKGEVEAGLRDLTEQLKEAEQTTADIKDIEDPAQQSAFADEYRQKLEDLGQKARELEQKVDDAVPDGKVATPEEEAASNAGKTVKEILAGKRGSIKQAPLEEGAPSWNDILDKKWEDIEQGARDREPGYDTFRKLLTDGRFDK